MADRLVFYGFSWQEEIVYFYPGVGFHGPKGDTVNSMSLQLRDGL